MDELKFRVWVKHSAYPKDIKDSILVDLLVEIENAGFKEYFGEGMDESNP